MKINEIIQGDCLEVMKSFPDNHFSAIVTDPPYGISFMGKGWDHEIPGIEYWKECIRITKPGGHLLAMGGTRTFHRLTCAIEDEGWEIRDCLMWIYGSGFPKSHNHFGIEGYGSALKPAYEPIIMAMKPLDGTFAQNAEKWGQAGINIDGCRIGFAEQKRCAGTRTYKAGTLAGGLNGEGVLQLAPHDGKGRWPANVMFDKEAGALLDEQSGVLKSGGGDKGNKTQNGGYGKGYGYIKRDSQGSTGGASCFFYCAKASSRERNEGLPEGKRSTHPTVKPIKLMEYLIKLVMPPKDGLLLDPFAGSGTTIIAAKRLGFNAIGIEKEPQYCEIARSRIIKHSDTDDQMELLNEDK